MSETLSNNVMSGEILSMKDNPQVVAIKDFANQKITTVKRNVGFGLAATGLVFVTGLFALQILSGIATLVVLAGATVGGLYGFRFIKANDLYVRQKIANEAFKRMVNEARKNNMSQLQRQILKNSDEYNRLVSVRDKVGGLVLKLEEQLDSSDSSSPLHEKKQRILDARKKGYLNLQKVCDFKRKENKKFEDKVSEFKDMQEFNETAQDIDLHLSSFGSKDVDDMLCSEAFDQILTDYHSNMATIENQTRDLEQLLKDAEDE